MDDTKIDRKIILMERDIESSQKEIAKLEAEYKSRPPARETYEHFNKYNVDFALMGEELKNLTKVICDSNLLNAEQHKQILDRIKRIEQFALGTLTLFALAAVYFIFTKTGLKIN